MLRAEKNNKHFKYELQNGIRNYLKKKINLTMNLYGTYLKMG